MHKKIYLGSLFIAVGIIGIWQLANAATTWQGPPTNCSYPGQTNCNTDGVVWNRSDTNFNTLPAQIGNFKVSGKGWVGDDFYMTDNKALQINKGGDALIRIGNWGGTGQWRSDLVVYGDLKVEQKGTMPVLPRIYTPWLCLNGDCRDVWPSGGGGGGGTVTSVGSGNGLTGGPITGAGTLSVMSCVNGQVLKTNASNQWYCGTDNDTNSGGTLTGVTAGTGISVSGGAPSPTVSINSSYGFGCSNGQVRKWNGSAWVCSGDVTATVGAGTGIIITGTAPNYTVNVDDNRYVNVAGDTMTGSLTVQQNLDGNLTNRFGYSGTLGDWLMNIQPAGNSILTRGTLTHTGAISASGNITSNGGSMSASSYCFNGVNCISAWPSAGTGDITGVTAGNGLTDGGASGDVTLNIGAGAGIAVAADTVGLALCGSGYIYKSNGSIMTCQPDATGSVSDVWVNTTGDTMTGTLTLGSWRLEASPNSLVFNGYINNGSAVNITNKNGSQKTDVWLAHNNFGGYFDYVNSTGKRLTDVHLANSQAGVIGLATNASGAMGGSFGYLDSVGNALYTVELGKSTHAIYAVGPVRFVGDVELDGSTSDLQVDGQVRIGTTNQETTLQVGTGETVNLTSDGFLMLGLKASSNLILNQNQIQARFNGGSTSLFLNNYGGNIYLGSSANGSQTVYSKGAVVTSDVRFKKDIFQLTDGLDKVMSLIPVSYRYKAQDESDKPNLGFIAQQVETVLPNLVKMDPETGYYYVSYEGVIPVTVKAIQEQQVEIEDLKAKNQELEARLKRLEALIK